LFLKIREIADCGDKEFITSFVDYAMPTFSIDRSFVDELKAIEKEFTEKDPVKYESFL